MTSPILMLGATHGDEPIGVRVLERLASDTTGFDWIIGNPPAFERGTRTFEGDLNRSAPGDPTSPQYASRRASEILKTASGYDACLDLHGTTAYTGIFIILTMLTEENLRLAAQLDIARIVYWPSITPELKGPLSEYFPCGLEIECGPKNMPAVADRLLETLRAFLKTREQPMSRDDARRILAGRSLYEVVGVDRGPSDGLVEFEPMTRDGVTMIPLLIGQYAGTGITCYTLQPKKLDDWWTD